MEEVTFALSVLLIAGFVMAKLGQLMGAYQPTENIVKTLNKQPLKTS